MTSISAELVYIVVWGPIEARLRLRGSLDMLKTNWGSLTVFCSSVGSLAL